MTWLAVLLLGVALVDLVRSRWPTPVVPEAVAAIAVLAIGALVGAGPDDLLALLAAAAVVVAWSLLVRRALHATALPWPAAADDPERLLLILGVAGVQLSTGNLVVRLVLSATDTVEPSVVDTEADPSEQLKGGRLLGPMERLVILGLGLAGQVTAASIVIAAKGLLRWPELGALALVA